jgi:hypothetical protein
MCWIASTSLEEKKRIIKLTADIGQSDVQSKRKATIIQQQRLEK